MSDIRGVASVTPTRVTEDDRFLAPQETRDGAVTVIDYALQRAIEGRVYSAIVGSAATPTSFAKTTYDADQPQLVVDVPDSTAIIPIRAQLALQDSAGTNTQILTLASTVNVGSGTSTAVTPVNHKFGSSNTSGCSAYSLYTGNGTDPTTGTEQWLDGWVYAFADATTDPVKHYVQDFRLNPVVIQGTGSLVFYVVGTGTAPAGFLKVSWIELPETMVA